MDANNSDVFHEREWNLGYGEVILQAAQKSQSPEALGARAVQEPQARKPVFPDSPLDHQMYW